MKFSIPQLRALYDQLSTEPQPSTGRPLQASTIHTIHAALHTALQDGLIDEVLVRNIADIAKPPSIKRRERPFLTPDQANLLLAKAAESQDRWEALYWLALNTAARESELLALRWSDILWDQGKITIRASKTDAGVRQPGVIPQVLEKLRAHKARLIEERLQAGPSWKDQGPFEQSLVFPSSTGQLQHVSGFLTYHFYPLLERAELPHIHFHDLRHTAISWLLSLGIPPVDVAKYVGHADAATTLRFYAHSLPNSQEAILAAIERTLGGNVHGQAVR